MTFLVRRMPLANWCSLFLEKCSGVFHSLPTSHRILHPLLDLGLRDLNYRAYLGGRLERSRLTRVLWLAT